MTIRGLVNAFLEAEVEILIRGSERCPDQTVRAIIDTGFDGYLSLPPNTVAELALPFLDRQKSMAFGGAVSLLDVHDSIIVFGGIEQYVPCVAADNPPLIGMALLHRFHLSIDIISDGVVELTHRPDESIAG